jgi:arsenate reductase-like glutaredoxin family protein
MDITDKEIAKIVKKSLQELEKLKNENEAEYKMLKVGAMCKKLDLDSSDLQKIYDKKVAIS